MYIVGLAGMFMLVALVSGVIIHRRIFGFLHPAALPMASAPGSMRTTCSVWWAFRSIWCWLIPAWRSSSPRTCRPRPVSYAGNVMQYFGEVMGSYHRDELHQPAGKPVSLDALIAESQRQWGGGEVGWVSVHHPDDASAVVDIRRRDRSRIASPQDTLTYDATSGELLNRRDASTGYRAYLLAGRPAHGAVRRHPGASAVSADGLVGCAMLIGGLQVWLAKREQRGDRSLPRVRALNGAVFGGLPLASLALLWGNRLIPTGFAERAVAEGWCSPAPGCWSRSGPCCGVSRGGVCCAGSCCSAPCLLSACRSSTG